MVQQRLKRNVLYGLEMCCNVFWCVAMYCDVLRMTGIKSSSWEGWKGSWLASERGLAPFQPSSVFLPGLRNIRTSSAKYLYKSWEIFQLYRLLKKLWLADRREVLPHVKCVCRSLLRHCMRHYSAWKSLNGTDLKSQFLCKRISTVILIQCQQQLNSVSKVKYWEVLNKVSHTSDQGYISGEKLFKGRGGWLGWQCWGWERQQLCNWWLHLAAAAGWLVGWLPHTDPPPFTCWLKLYHCLSQTQHTYPTEL